MCGINFVLNVFVGYNEVDMLRDDIKNLIARALDAKAQKLLKSAKLDIHVEHPGDPTHGDFSTNVAMQLAKPLKKDPRILADLLVDKLISDSRNLFTMVEVDGPGFINFFLKSETLHEELSDILKKKETYGKLTTGKNSKVNVEFISANPTGELHIGNGRGAFMGDSLVKILTYVEYETESEYYVNNAKVSEQIINLGKAGQGKSDMYPHVKAELKEHPQLEKKVKSAKTSADAGFLLAQHYQKKNKEVIGRILGIHFNKYVPEQDLYERGLDKKILNLLDKKGRVYSKDGARWFQVGKRQDEEVDFVLVRSSGAPTYILSDLMYHWHKFKERKIDKAIDFFGSDHHGYTVRLRRGVEALGISPDSLEIILTQFVRLVDGGKEVKMSKRKGDFDTLEQLVDEVGLDATRFFFLQRSPETHMDFDLNLAKEQSEKNPVYYVQYAHARICSILRKAGTVPARAGTVPALLVHPSELALIKELIKFPEIIEDTANDYQVQRLPHYAIKVADLFHRFYHDCRVLTEDKKLTDARLSLVLATKIIIKHTLDLMGVTAPEKM